LEIRHDPHSNVCEAPIQMKSNCGCLLIDDFGRHRIETLDLLYRWIVPLENRIDFLTLPTGKKIQVPFEQLIIFSTNLEPKDLVDEAFLRRIPYKIEIKDPDLAEFRRLFDHYAGTFQCDNNPEVVDWLLATHYRPHRRAMRRCHPRDLLAQVRNYCSYNGYRMEMKREYLDRVVTSYFTVVNGLADESMPRAAASSPPVASSEAMHTSVMASPASTPSPRDASGAISPTPPQPFAAAFPTSNVTSVPPVAAPSVQTYATEAMPSA
jgi:hypothetical protein